MYFEDYYYSTGIIRSNLDAVRDFRLRFDSWETKNIDEPNHRQFHHHHSPPSPPPPPTTTSSSSSSSKTRRDSDKERPTVTSEPISPITARPSRHADALPPQEQLFERQERKHATPSNGSSTNDRQNHRRTPLDSTERRDRGRPSAIPEHDIPAKRTSPSSSSSATRPPISQNNSVTSLRRASAPSTSTLAQASTSMAPSADESRSRRKRSPSTSTEHRSVEGRRSDNKIRKVSPSDPMDIVMSDAQPSSAPPLPTRVRQYPQELHHVPITLPPRPEASVVRDRGASAADEQMPVERYFVIKSANFENVQRSQRDGVWATQEMNAAKLSEAFQKTNRVILIFSVNGSQHFQGYAMMCSGVGAVKYDKWTSISESSLGGTFRVKWLKIENLPFERTNNIRNSWNEDLPVKRSRDGQELPSNVGEMLCRMFNEIPEGGYPETTPMKYVLKSTS
ncbi:YT521-B-like domain-containing protein [Endogone sp. FLAS-F59071]|nr:YT521-B-like domain-containing protein [Endogone sp. FLAS-F59071]|eukprot:RUS18679.1 YT521-B-like domain-containing protein [Endogone sp. FLAS-F59071]